MEIVRYPDSRIEVLDERFAKYKLANAALEMLWTGGRWLEGPVWFGDGRYLLFSDIPNNRILKWEEETGEPSRSSASHRTTPTATRAIARGDCCRANTTRAGSRGRNTTVRSLC